MTVRSRAVASSGWALLLRPAVAISLLGAVVCVVAAVVHPVVMTLSTAPLGVLNAWACVALDRRARRSARDHRLWHLTAWGFAALSVAWSFAALWRASGRPDGGTLALALLVLVLVQQAVVLTGTGLWGVRARWRPVAAGRHAEEARADRYELLLTAAAVLLLLAAVEAATLTAPGVAAAQSSWDAWWHLQVGVVPYALTLANTGVLLGVAHVLGAGRERAVRVLAAALAAPAVGAAVQLLDPSQTLAPAVALCVSLLLAALAGHLPEAATPRRTRWRELHATVSSFTVLTLSLVGLAAVALAGARSTPTLLAVIVLTLLSAVLAATRLLLNLRHLRWSVASYAEAVTDELTGLPNRRGLLAQLQRACDRDLGLRVALVDVDRFKSINDSLGHQAGDELVREVSRRLLRAQREGVCAEGSEVLVARLGGDEFVALVVDPPSAARGGGPLAEQACLVGWGRELLAAFSAPFELEGLPVHVTASAGLAAVGPGQRAARTPSEVLRRVDAAMYEAKGGEVRGRGVVYDAARHDEATQRLLTVQQLRRGLEADELRLHFQPQLEGRTGAVVGVEALVRWQHPTRGLLGPGEFVDLAEANGLMGPLTDVVLEGAVRQLVAWRDDRTLPAAVRETTAAMTVSVNLSATSLLDGGLPDRLASLLLAHDVPPRQLVLEVTESVLLRDPERSVATTTALRSLGVGMSIDDFGTGYSSLTQLRRLAVDELKLDRAFTTELGRDPRAELIVRSTVELAHGLGMRVVAEGVEDEVTLEQLLQLGCDVTQGHLHSRAVGADDLTAWLRVRPVAAVRTPS